jgi:hypothetical protein
MISATIQAGASPSCTSEMNAADVSNLSAIGIEHLPQPGHLTTAPREVAIEPVGDRRECKDRRADQLPLHPENPPALELRQEHYDQERHEKHAHQCQRIGQIHRWLPHSTIVYDRGSS